MKSVTLSDGIHTQNLLSPAAELEQTLAVRMQKKHARTEVLRGISAVGCCSKGRTIDGASATRRGQVNDDEVGEKGRRRAETRVQIAT